MVKKKFQIFMIVIVVLVVFFVAVVMSEDVQNMNFETFIGMFHGISDPKNSIFPTTSPVITFSPTETPTLEPSPFFSQNFPYIVVVDSCGPYYNDGVCVNMRSGPGIDYPVVARLREGVVLKVAETIKGIDRDWYKISIDKELRYPERVEGDWFVASDVVELFYDDGDHYLQNNASGVNNKYIIVSISKNMLYAYEDDELFMAVPISTGLEFTPTPKGAFTVFKMTPSRYMQGPIEGLGDDYYDLPGVPWNLYFTKQGAVIHGAYWHDHFGSPWSHGCVNLSSEKARELYMWTDIGTKIIIQ